MGAASSLIGVNGATLSALPEVTRRTGYLYEAVRRDSTLARRATPLRPPSILPTARAAVRLLRVDVRGAHSAGMTPREISRAVEWTESGWLQALGLLTAGEPCGLTVVLGSGAVIEWSVRPARLLALEALNTRIALDCPRQGATA
ncbi:hypothetical protein ACWC98_05350 [Streptomyces goshikiensis]|nr:hypothetical protein GCM10010278_09390 [Streptomyces melanogenes]